MASHQLTTDVTGVFALAWDAACSRTVVTSLTRHIHNSASAYRLITACFKKMCVILYDTRFIKLNVYKIKRIIYQLQI